MAPRRAALTAAAFRPNTRQLLLRGHGGQRPGGTQGPHATLGASAAHQCSMTTRGPMSPGLPSSWAWARARFCGAPTVSGASAAAGCWAPRFLPRGAILGEPRRWSLRRSGKGAAGMPLRGEKGAQVPRYPGSEKWVPVGTLLWQRARKGQSPAIRHRGK